MLGILSRFLDCPSKQHFVAAKHMLRYIKGTTNFAITYSQDSAMKLLGYADADFQNYLDTRKSITGYVFQLGGSPIDWRSHRQSVVAQSTTEAEYVAINEAGRQATWLRRLLSDLGVRADPPVLI